MRQDILPTSVRLTKKETEFLEKYAIKNNLLKADGSVPKNSVIKHMINEKMNDSVIDNDDIKENLLKIKSMLEQIHVTIPHIVNDAHYSALYAFKSLSENTNDTHLINQFKTKINEYNYETIGAFQQYNYETLYCSSNIKNMKTIPIEKEKNRWK